MIIEFPKTYSIEMIAGVAFVSMPLDSIQKMIDVCSGQSWVISANISPDKTVVVRKSNGYQISEREFIDALSKLAEYVLNPESKPYVMELPK